MSVSVSGLIVYLLVFVRLVACLAFNPIFNRNAWPNQTRMGFVLLLTLLVAPGVPYVDLGNPNFPQMIGYIIIEVLVGLFLGFIIQIYSLLLAFAGELLDSQFGLAMAKNFDPATDVQSGAVGGILNMLLVMCILVTNAHLEMIEAFVRTFEMIPFGSIVNVNTICAFVFSTFIDAFNLVIRLALPFVVCEFLLEISLGILMKMIPQIHVFVINIQLKILLGLLLMILLNGSLSMYLNSYIDKAVDTMQNAIVEISLK